MSFTTDWRDVHLAAGARAVSFCGDALAATVLVLMLQQAGLGGLAVAGLMIAAALPIAVLAPVGGRIADRWDSRRILVVAGLAQTLICLALAMAGTDNAPLVLALVALLSCGLAITQPTMSALLPAMVRDEDLPRASGLFQMAGTIGMLIGPALAGVLLGHTGPRLPLLLDAASFLAVAAAGLLLRTRRHDRDPAVPITPYRMRDDRTLAVLTAATAATVVALSAVNVFIVFLIRDTMGASTTVYGLVEASWTAGMAIGALAAARIPRHRMTGPALLATLAASCVLIIAAATAPSAALLIPFWVAGGFANAVTLVMVSVIVASRTPAEARGRAYAIFGAAVQTAAMAGLVLGGPLVDHFAPRGLLVAAGAVSLVVSLGCLAVVRWRETPRAVIDQSNMRDSVGG